MCGQNDGSVLILKSVELHKAGAPYSCAATQIL